MGLSVEPVCMIDAIVVKCMWHSGGLAWHCCNVDAVVADSRVQQVAGAVRTGIINLCKLSGGCCL